MSRNLLISFTLLAVSLALANLAIAADGRLVSVDVGASREAKLEGVRVVLLSAGYETVFTGDADPKKATIRRLNVILMVEPLGKHAKGPALGIGPIAAFAAGTETAVKTDPMRTQGLGKGTSYELYDRKERFAMPKVEDEQRTLVFEQSVGPVVAEPGRIDFRIKVHNREQGGTCLFKGIPLK
jgi:hypothetical protein